MLARLIQVQIRDKKDQVHIFMLNNKILSDFTNLFASNNSKENDKIIIGCFH